MAKAVYIGVNNKARKVKQIYVGVNNKARRVKKGYIGVGGVARPFWGEKELLYYGTITALRKARYYLAATTLGDYALFGGGCNGSNNSDNVNTVDAYNTSLTRSTPTPLSQARSSLAATTLGDYALFGGDSVVDAYNKSLTRSTPTALSQARSSLAATTLGDYALFGGGDGMSYSESMGSYTNSFNTVDAYNTSLTRSTPTPLSQARSSLAATTLGDYALFGGGNTGSTRIGGTSGTSVVDAYNKSLTRSTPTALSAYRLRLAATTLGDYALFGGGDRGSEYASSNMTPANHVEVYIIK